MASKISPPPNSIGRALNFTTGRMNALCQRLLDSHDLSLPQWVILSCLWRDGEITVSALADLVGNGLPATSRIVDRMVDRRMLARRKHKTDGRAIVVTLTEKGNELRHLSDFHQRINAKLFKGFSPEEQDLAFSLLARIQANAETEIQERAEQLAEQKAAEKLNTLLPAMKQAADRLAQERDRWLADWEASAIHLAVAIAE